MNQEGRRQSRQRGRQEGGERGGSDVQKSDGGVLQVKDEDSLKQELGLPLALRRRLLFFVESLREEERRESAGEGRVEE
eukprot:757940-Hanusia_phi.AAC.2